MSVAFARGSLRLARGRVSVIAVLLMLVSLSVGVLLGQWTSYIGLGLRPAGQLGPGAAPGSSEDTENLRMQLEVALSRSQVDRRALELLRREIASQKEQIANLEEGIRFYRSLMAPGEIAQGLSLRELELVSRDSASRFGYRIVVQQEARKHNLVKGKLSARVFGDLAGEPVEYALAELSEDIDAEGQVLRFRYFQSIEGELTLPEGFEPAGFQVSARFTSPRVIELDERYDWQLKESFTHVGD